MQIKGNTFACCFKRLERKASVTIVNNDILGPWDTTRLNTGDYFLRLVVTDNAGQSLPPCTIQVRVEAPIEE